MNRETLICLFLIAATLVVFWQVRNYDFVDFDDNVYVTENPHVQAGISRKSVSWAFTSFHAGFWLPLTWLSFMLDFELYGLKAGGYHLTNVLLHLANTLLLFLVLKRMTGDLWRSGFVACLFALHPLRVESVAWVTERKDVLSTFFWILAIWSYVRFADHPRMHRYLFVLLAFAFGLMAKPMVVTLPFVLLLLDYWPLNRMSPAHIASANGSRTTESMHSKPIFALVLEKLPLFAIAALASAVTFFVKQGTGAIISLQVLPTKIRLANALVSYVKYLGKVLWPYHLAVFYPHPLDTLQWWHGAAAGVLLIVLTLLIIRRGRRLRYLVVGWLWYLGTLVPVIGLVQAGPQAMADRFTYVPIIGLFIMVAWGIPDLLAKWRYARIALPIVSVMVLSILMVSSWMQVQLWRNSITLFTHALKVTSDNFIAHNNLGVGLLKQGQPDQAIGHFRKALQINPNYGQAYYSLAYALAEQGKLHQAISHYRKALQINPHSALAHNNLGNALAALGKRDEAGAHYAEALRIEPYYAEAHNNLATVLANEGKIQEAIVHYTEALSIKPNYAEAHNNLAVALAREGKLNEAISHYTEALRIKSNYLEAHVNMGTILYRLGKLSGAEKHYSEALRLQPNNAKVHNMLGAVLARQGKLEQAVDHFSTALRLNPDYSNARINREKALLELRERQ